MHWMWIAVKCVLSFNKMMTIMTYDTRYVAKIEWKGKCYGKNISKDISEHALEENCRKVCL